jgi:hypothetical protein
MEALMQEIGGNIRLSVHDFIRKVSDKYGVDFDELIEMWENSDIIQSKSKVITKAPAQKQAPKVVQKSAPQSPEPDASDGCPYIYTKGEKEGQSCGIKPKGGVVYCTRHKKYEGQEPKQKKVIPSAKKSIAGSTSSRTTSPPVKEVNTVLRKHKAIDKLWHSATGMVFKSAKERVVIGKCVDDKLLPLQTEDIEICMAHSFAYDDSWEEEKMEEENVPVAQVKNHSVTPKKVEPEKGKKSISEAIREANIKASDVEDILCELQLPVKKKFSTPVKDDDEEDEDLVENDLEEDDLSEELEEEDE